MKKNISILLLLSLILFSGCRKAVSNEAVRVAGMKGPTSMGMVYLMKEAEDGIVPYTFSIHGSADEISPKLIRGELDFACIPANLASVLWNNTNGALTVLAINTYGVLYLVEKGDSVKDLSSLKGKTIYATGKGSTPEYTLRYLLSLNGLDPDKDVTLEFRSEPAEIVALLRQNDKAIALLPQPYTTAAQSAVPELHIVADLSKVWEQSGANGKLITGVLVVRTEFLEKHPEAVRDFLKAYRTSIEQVLADDAAAAELIARYGIADQLIAEKALPYCSLTYADGKSMKKALSGYLEALYEQNPKAIGGSLPDDSFYYIR